MKKFATMAISVALIGAMVAGGSLAYLSDTDSDVNVMTLGQVKIEQLEYERVVDENGKWESTGETDKYGYTPDKLQEFTQAKSLLPAVFADGKIKWDDRNGSSAEDGTGHQQSWAQVGASGSNQLFDDSVKNVQDKFVFVKNTGKSDAYVRTLIAFEQGSVAKDDFRNVIMTNTNGNHWDKLGDKETWIYDVEIDGNKYVVATAVYKGPKSNPTGILAPDTVSYPSLLQVYMRPEATNEDVEAVDGNKNGTYDILVLSQAVQAQGFADAETALKAAFGEFNEVNVKEWFGDPVIPTVYEVKANDDPAVVKEAFEAAVTANDEAIVVNLDADVVYDVNAWQNEAMGGNVTQEIVINGNGHTITFNQLNSDWNNIVTNGAKLVINDAKITNSGHNDGPWNRHDLNFACDVELNNVTSDKAFAFKAGAVLKNVTIDDANTSNTYAIWVQPNGQTITLDGCTIDMLDATNGRGIKIDNQYVEDQGGTSKLVTLNVKDTAFKTEEKSAILVKTPAGANITLDNVDISGVAADSTNAVWVDEDAASYADLVKVTGGSVIVEGAVSNADELAVAVAAGKTNIWLKDGVYDVKNCGGKTLTINGSKDVVIKIMNEGEDGCDYGFGAAGTGIGNITFNGVTIDTTANTGNYKGFAYMKGTFNNCNFVGAYSLNNANDFAFNNCTFDFKNGYFWTWGANSVTFDNCVFNGNSKNILAHGYASTVINIKDCKFAATDKGYTGSGDNTACVEIDPAGTNTYTINFTGNNTKTESYADWTRIKDGSTGHAITGV